MAAVGGKSSTTSTSTSSLTPTTTTSASLAQAHTQTSETPLAKGGVSDGMSEVTRTRSHQPHVHEGRRNSVGMSHTSNGNTRHHDESAGGGTGEGGSSPFTSYQTRTRPPAYSTTSTASIANANDFASVAGSAAGPGSSSASASVPNSATSSPLLPPSQLQHHRHPQAPPLLSNLSPFNVTTPPQQAGGTGYPFPASASTALAALAQGQAQGRPTASRSGPPSPELSSRAHHHQHQGQPGSTQLQHDISNLAITPTPANPLLDRDVNASMPAVLASRQEHGSAAVPPSSSSSSMDPYSMPAWLAAAQQQQQQQQGSGGGPFYVHNPYLVSSSSNAKNAPAPPQQQPSTLGLGFLQSSSAGQPVSFTASPKSTFAAPNPGDGGAGPGSRRSSRDDYAVPTAGRKMSSGDAVAANAFLQAAAASSTLPSSSSSRPAPLPQYDPSGHRNMSWTPSTSSTSQQQQQPSMQHRGSMSSAPPPPLDAHSGSASGSGSTADVRSLPATPIMSISRRVSGADSTTNTPYGSQGPDDAMQGSFWNGSNSSASAMDVERRQLSHSPTAKTNRVGGRGSEANGASTPGGGARGGSRSRSSTNSMPAAPVTQLSSEGDSSVKMEQDEGDDKIDHRKRKRNRTIQSCLPCHQNKRKCDRKRPCSRCTALGLTGSCVYEVDHARNPDDPEQTETEHLRGRIAELEQVVRELRQRGTTKNTGGSTSGSSTPRDQGMSEPAEKKRKLIVDRFARFKLDEAHHGMLARTAIGNAMAAEQGLRLNLDPESDASAGDGAPRTIDGRRRTSAEQSVEPYIAHANSVPGEELVGDAQGREAYVGVPGGRSMLRRLAEITADKAPDAADKELMTVPEDVAFTGFFPDMRKTFPFTTIWSHENFIGEIIGLLPTKKQAEQ